MTTTIHTPLGASIEGAGPDRLRDLLNEHENQLKSLGLPVDDCLAPGLPAETIVSKLRSAGLGCPEELLVWFSWHNGLVAAPKYSNGLPFVRPLSIEGAIANYEYGRASDVEVWSFAEGWLPLEDLTHGYHVDVRPDTSSQVLVRHSDEEHPLSSSTSSYQVVSLSTLVAWWVEAVAAGVTRWDSDHHRWRTDIKALPSVQLASGMFF